MDWVVAGLCCVAVLFILRLYVIRSRQWAAEIEEVHRLSCLLEKEKAVRARDRESLLSGLGIPFVLVDRKGCILLANAPADDLFQSGGILRRNILQLLDELPLVEAMRKMINAEEMQESVVKFSRQNVKGKLEECFWQLIAIPLENTSDHVGIVIHDKTKEHQVQQMRRDFVANASHELRTPLTIIRAYLENFLEDEELFLDQELRQKTMKVMMRHTKRITRIIDDMLMISKLENVESSPLRQSQFVLSDVLAEVKSLLEAHCQEKQSVIECEFSEEPFNMLGDTFYWTQIFFNLLENALKQNVEQGLKLGVCANKMEGGSIEIVVWDKGVGIPSAHLPFVFNRFYRVDTQHSSAIKGTGLGLSIVARAVDAHGGKIRVSSIPGEKTKFVITLPKPNFSLIQGSAK